MSTLCLNTAVITYACGKGLSVGIVAGFIEKKLGKKGYKCVIAKEQADEKINQDHYHIYLDLKKPKTIRPTYFDIKFDEPLYVFIKEDTSRDYLWESELNANKIDPLNYVKENGYLEYKKLIVNHPNIENKKTIFKRFFITCFPNNIYSLYGFIWRILVRKV